jgi:hypothetical protein
MQNSAGPSALLRAFHRGKQSPSTRHLWRGGRSAPGRRRSHAKGSGRRVWGSARLCKALRQKCPLVEGALEILGSNFQAARSGRCVFEQK